MAYIRKRGKKWAVEVEVLGQTANGSFSTKAEAHAWAVETEKAIRSGANIAASGKTVGDVFDKFADEEAPHRTKAKWETNRLAFYGRYEFDWADGKRGILAAIPLERCDQSVITRLRDARTKEVSGETFIRDLNLLGTVFKTAAEKWRWIERSPTLGVKRPKPNPPRTRTASEDEIESLKAAAMWNESEIPTTLRARSVAAFIVCCESGLRGGELMRVRPSWVDREARVIRLPHFERSKTRARDAAISERGMAVLEKVLALGLDPVFGMNDSQKDADFRDVRDRAGLGPVLDENGKVLEQGLNFHDSRATFCTWASKRIPVQALSRQLGHANLQELMTYYRESGEEIAKML